MAILGIHFLEKNDCDKKGNWFFSLAREGRPLIHPYNVFSDCFVAMAFAQISKATVCEEYSEIAVKTFKNILRRAENPKGKSNKTFPGTRPLKGFSLLMIFCSLSLEIKYLPDKKLVQETIDECIYEVLEIFYDSENGLIPENVLTNGKFSHSFEGRLLNPGHAIEAMCFIMDLSERLNDKNLLMRAKDIAFRTLKYDWDKEHSGSYYFLDIEQYSPQQLEWDQKLWWAHVEALITMLKGYYLTHNPICLEWFYRPHDYTWSHLPDYDYGEFLGYLNKQGNILLPLKGGKWKGCFHVPRGLSQCYMVLEKLN